MTRWIVREERIRSQIVEAATEDEAERAALARPDDWSGWDETIEAEEYEY